MRHEVDAPWLSKQEHRRSQPWEARRHERVVVRSILSEKRSRSRRHIDLRRRDIRPFFIPSSSQPCHIIYPYLPCRRPKKPRLFPQWNVN